jgi:RNA polymerase sigma-70 factor (ECF subfamily)
MSTEFIPNPASDFKPKPKAVISVHELLSIAEPFLRELSKGALPHKLRRRLGESDLVQDAIIGATQSRSQFRGSTPESLKAWLREIFQNRLQNLIRAHVRSQKRSVLREEPLVLEPIHDRDSALTTLTKKETVDSNFQRMQEAFQLLSIHDRQVLELHSRLGHSMAQISEMLRVPEPTVRKRYSRAIRRWQSRVHAIQNGRP